MKIQLSISLLASNRAASLERCLDSLRPLLMSIPSELIVVFTGTDERVREIAARYTEQIVPFAWCGDFSAARNAGLKQAKGEWFLYIDDDEWFEDVTDIRDFFLTGEYRNYHCACYVQKNFLSWDGLQYSDFSTCRMAKRTPGMRFQNPIHEELAPMSGPCKYLDTYVNHYGYAPSGDEKGGGRPSRNIPLLLSDIEERPHYLKNYLQIAQEYQLLQDYEKAEKYCRMGRALWKQGQSESHLRWFQAFLISILYEKGDKYQAEKEAVSILENEDPSEIVSAVLSSLLSIIYAGWKVWEKALDYGRKFEKLIACMDENPKLWEEQSYGGLDQGMVKKPERLFLVRTKGIEAALALKEFSQASYFLSLLPWEDEARIMTYYPLFDGWKKDHGSAFLTLLSDIPHTSPYLLLEGTANQEGEVSREDRQRLLLRCLKESRSPYLWQRILKEALLSDMPLLEFADILGLEDFCACSSQAAGQLPFSQTSKIRRAAADLERTRPLPGIWLYRLFLKKELTQGYLMGDTLRETLEAYGQCTLRFYQEQYREDLFSETNRALLPKDCRFAFLLLEALQALQAEELPRAIRLFHSAIRLGPDLTGVIREILREVKEDGEAPERAGEAEFQSLAGQMKASIEGMAEKGAYEEALSLAAQLSPLLPKDLELLRLRQRLLCQMNRTSRLKDLALWEE